MTEPLDLPALRAMCKSSPGGILMVTRHRNGESESFPEKRSEAFYNTARSALPAALDEIARLRGLLGEACAELDDTGGEFAKVEAARIRTAGGLSDE